MPDEEGSSLEMLSLLKQASDEYISGEYLSKCLGITRTAVWKKILALKKEGFVIESSTKKGYRLTPSCDTYGRAAILSGLSTKTMGRHLKFFHAVDSTNTVLKQLAADGAPEGTVAAADIQNAGRGRLGRNWASPPGMGIWMSVLLRPSLHPSLVQTLTLAASVAVCQALEPLGITGLGIKWPNDILIGGKKVCGILTELSAEMERVAWVILGIGLNVNHLKSDFPDELIGKATSLRMETTDQNPLNRGEMAARIINSLEDVYDKYLQMGSGWVAEQWRKWNLTLGKRVRLVTPDGDLEVTAEDITPDGRLVVKKDDGMSMEIISGEISLRTL